MPVTPSGRRNAPRQPSAPAALRQLQAALTQEVMRGGTGRKIADASVRRLLAGSRADQGFRLAAYRESYERKLRGLLGGYFPILFGQLAARDADELARACSRVDVPSGPLIERAPLRRALAEATKDRPALAELAALDDARYRLYEAVSTRPRARAPCGAWLNPNVAFVRAALPLDAVWAATVTSRRIALKRGPRKLTYAVVIVPGGMRVERLTPSEERALSQAPRGPRGNRVIESLMSKAVLLAD